MIEEELIKIWQSSPNQERVKFEKSRLMIDVQSSIDSLHKSIKYRDMREQIAVAIGVPVFAYYTYAVPHFWSKVASVLIIGYGLFVSFKLRSAKKHKPGEYSEPYLTYLLKTREYLNIQKRLLDTVIYWYILPGMTLTMLFVMGKGIVGRIKPITIVAIGNVVLAVTLYFLNKTAVEKQIMPRIAKVDELIALMEKS